MKNTHLYNMGIFNTQYLLTIGYKQVYRVILANNDSKRLGLKFQMIDSLDDQSNFIIFSLFTIHLFELNENNIEGTLYLLYLIKTRSIYRQQIKI